MKIWTCTSCGATERLTATPDACSVCGGQMETLDDRFIGGFCEGVAPYRAKAFVEPWAAAAIADFEAEMAQNDVGTVIRHWQDGHDLNSDQQAIMDQVLAGNRLDLIITIYDQAA